jgi:hypothetical protein
VLDVPGEGRPGPDGRDQSPAATGTAARRPCRAAAYEAAVTALGIQEVEDQTRTDAERLDDPLVKLSQEHELPDPIRLAKAGRQLEAARRALTDAERSLGLLEALPGMPDGVEVDAGAAYGSLQELVEIAGETGSGVPDPEDEDFLAGVGVPADAWADPYSWDGRTAGLVRKGVALIAASAKAGPDALLARALKAAQRSEGENRGRAQRCERKVRELRRRVRAQEDRLRRRLLPSADELGKVLRYEGHVGRQLQQAPHTLQRLQAARAGEYVPPPAALDVTLDADTSPAAPLPAIESAPGRT